MNLGEPEKYEIWFMPKNQESHFWCIAEFLSIEDARQYIDAHPLSDKGFLEIVRVKTSRQRVC